MSRVERVVERIVRLAPASFRVRYGEEYLATLRERMEHARAGGKGGGLAAKEIAGAVRTVVRLRLGWASTPVDQRRRRGGANMLDTLWHDVGHAARAVRRSPGFTATAVVVLSLGIGASTAIFSAVNAFFFRPMPFDDAERLVVLFETNPEFGWEDVNAAPANALDWREQVQAFDDVALYRDIGVGDATLQLESGPTLVGNTTVSGNFFDVLGVRPALGRTFTWNETWQGAADVIVLSHALWVRAFGADPSVVETTVSFADGVPRRIVGVMPEGFAFPNDLTELWSPYGWEPSARDQVWFRRAHFVRAIARLAPGVSIGEADAQLQTVVGRLQTDYPETNRVMGAGLMPVRDFLVRGVRTPLGVLLGAGVVLLLLACANVANLMLVRANDRMREVAVRNALGAGRRRIAGQLLTESVVVGLAGGAVGLALGWVGVEAMSTMTRLGIDGATGIALDARVAGFALIVSVLSGALFGTLPALRSARGDIQSALRDGGRGRSVGVSSVRAVRALVAVEVALALLLVLGAGLMIRSLQLLRGVDPGFEVQGTLAVELTVPSSRYSTRDEVLAFWDDLQAGLEARPGIERAGVVGGLPLAGTGWSSQFQAEGWPPERVGFEIIHRRADAGYFEALGIPLVRGRLFRPDEGPDAPLVVVVNETFAREHFPGEDPIGQRIAYDRAPTPESIWYEIVGIVGDQHQESPRTAVRAEVFENRNQDWNRTGWVVVSTNAEPTAIVPVVREVLSELDGQIPLADARTLREVWSASMDREEFILTLLTVFGLAALLLATVGVYGVTAQAARRRTQEIGIRMALGAGAGEVVGLMLRQGLGAIFVGLAVGLVLALVATRALSSMLYGVEPTDPATIASVVALLGAVALSACYLPARRATAVDPVTSLRAE